MGCRICRHALRVSIEASASTETVSAIAARYGLSERSLERHLRNIANGVCALSSSEASADDEETPPTTRSPGSDARSGVRLTVDVDERAVASVVLREIASARAQLTDAIAKLDGLRDEWLRRAEVAA